MATGTASAPVPGANLPCPLQHRQQQHIAPRLQVIGPRILDLVVADAILARHEDHAGRRQAGHVDGVVAGARHHVHGRVAQRFGGLAHRAHAVGVEGQGG